MGEVTVAYREQRPALVEGPFLKEERALLDAVADQLAGIIQERRARDALSERELFYRTILEDLPGLVCRWLPDRRVSYVNADYCTFFGVVREQVIGSPLALPLHPDDRPALEADLALLSDTHSTVTSVLRAFDARSETRWMRILTRGLMDQRGLLVEYQSVMLDITQERKAEEEIRNLALFPGENPDPTLRISADGILLYANAASRMLLDHLGVVPGGRVSGTFSDEVGKAIAAGVSHRFTDAVGSRWFGFNVVPITGAGYANLYGADVTQRNHDAERLRRLNRTHAVLSQCNRTPVHAESERQLLDEYCWRIVETGAYRFAWIGFPTGDPETPVQPVSQAGHEENYLAHVRINLLDPQRSQGPVARVLRTGKAAVERDIARSPGFPPWRVEALRRGYRSIIALPLKDQQELVGVLTIYADDPAALDDEEVVLLEELSDDLAYGLRSLRTREARACRTGAVAAQPRHRGGEQRRDHHRGMLQQECHRLRQSGVHADYRVFERRGDRAYPQFPLR